LIECREGDGHLIFRVRVVPRASQSGVAGEHGGALRVRVAAPPVEGAANEELIRTLARALKVPSRNVEIMTGHTSKIKQVRVHGAERRALEILAVEK
jgi:uncharacterized protein (TIGR00251 family)